jgi:hypothetical protein
MAYSHRALSQDQIRRLKAYGAARRLDIPQLNLAMDAPFTWTTLSRALDGKAVRQRNYQFIVRWIERFLPEKPMVDRKAISAGNHQESEL